MTFLSQYIMRLPQLVQEIIDYYLYFAPWKAKIVRCNREYKTIYKFEYGTLIASGYIYGWRNLENNASDMVIDIINRLGLYNHTIRMSMIVQKHLPPRYIYSNTKEQLKSLYF